MAASAILAAGAAVHGYQQQKKAVAEMAKVQQDQINDQAQQRTLDRMEEARALRAQARAAAAEAAVSGNSIDLLLDDITGQAGRDVSIIERNRRNGVLASDAEASARLRGAHAEMVGGVLGSATNFGINYSRYKIGTG